MPTNLIPTDGIVRETALKVTKGADTDIEKARAIYDWVVDNTYRDPKTRGCGIGDIKFLLESGNLGRLVVEVKESPATTARGAEWLRLGRLDLVP